MRSVVIGMLSPVFEDADDERVEAYEFAVDADALRALVRELALEAKRAANQPPLSRT